MDRAFVSSPWSCRQAPSSPEASPSGEAIASMSRGRGSRQRCVFCILWDIVGNMLWDIVDIVGNMLWDIVGYCGICCGKYVVGNMLGNMLWDIVENMLWEICCGILWEIVGYCGNYVVGTMLWDIVGYCGIQYSSLEFGILWENSD